MSGFLEDTERAALRGVAHLLPPSWRRVVDLLLAPIPPTPSSRVAAPDDEIARRLDRVGHVVVVMLENRSFDHMLGYLSLPAEQGGRGRKIEGLQGPPRDSNPYDGKDWPVHKLDRTEYGGEDEDPDHSGRSVHEQMEEGNKGFVKNFARISQARAHREGKTPPSPDLVMGYYNADDLPVYDHLAEHFCVVDRWFSSVPGATWPNRLYAATGRAAGTRDDIAPPLYALPSFVRHLDEHHVDWRWYSFDPATLRAIDPAYRFTNHDRFAYVDARKISTKERAVGELTEEGPSFLDDVASGELPPVSWIDPRFKDLRVLGPNSNDDHPPSDVLAGQDRVLSIYHALSSKPEIWKDTLLVITYDEHGGFYDHVTPPAAVDDDHEFQSLGLRVPALVVSPLVAPGKSTSELDLGAEIHFDHTSIIKTILTRFCRDEQGQIPAMTARVAAANHLGHLLTGTDARPDVPDHTAVAQTLQQWRERWTQARFTDPVAAAEPPKQFSDFQTGFYEMARLLRQAGLPGGHP
jgi:phospholipase C